MANPTFGVTVLDLETEMFGEKGITGGPRGQATAERLIVEICTEVAQRIRAVRIDPATIDAAGAPEAFGFCRTTVMYGVAAELTRRIQGTEPELAASREEKYQARLSQITHETHIVLRDAALRTSSGSVRHVFV